MRRAVVERPDADVQQVLGDLACLAGQPLHQIAADASLGQDAGAVGGDTQQVARAVLVDALERVEDRGDQHGAAVMRLGVVLSSRTGSASAAPSSLPSLSSIQWPIMLRSAPRLPSSASPNCVASSPSTLWRSSRPAGGNS